MAALYFASARLGLYFDAVSGVATPVWPPTGISLAALLLLGPSLWPAIALGAFAANAASGIAPAVAVGIAVGNTLEAALGAWLLRRLGLRPALDRLRDVVALVVGGALLSTLVSASGGAAVVWAAGQTSQVADLWRVWWVGDMMGDLLIAPVLLTWAGAWKARRSPGALLEGAALGVTLVVVSVLVFHDPLDQSFRRVYSLLPVLVWAAVRFGQRGVASSLIVVTVIAVWGTALGRGAFAGSSRVEGLFQLQTCLGVLATTFLVLGAAIEERARLVADLGEAVRVRDDFLSVAGHELKTPLSALRVQLASLRRLERTPEQTTRTLAATDRSITSLTKMIDQLLDVTRVRAGMLALERAEVSLTEVVEEVVARTSDPPPDGPIRISSSGPVIGRWDRARIDQAVTNLVGNAVKYGGGKPIDVRVDQLDQIARLTVRDRGMGIAKDQQQRIFERFERAVSGSHYGGLGLGLWIVREIIDAHGGRVTVESDVGQGATFVVELPRAISDGGGA